MKDNQVEELEHIKQMNGRLFITASEASPACGFSAESIRWQAKKDAEEGRLPGTTLGFRCSIAGERVNVHRQSFIRFAEGGDGLGTD